MVNKSGSHVVSVLIIICVCWLNCIDNVPSVSASIVGPAIIQQYDDRQSTATAMWAADSRSKSPDAVSQTAETSQTIVDVRQQLVIDRNDLIRRAQINSINVSDDDDDDETATNYDISSSRIDGQRRLRRDTNERNLCKSVCNCELNKNFLSVDCAFQQEFAVLKPPIHFPNTTTLVHIRLSQNAGLRIDENMFASNRINRISINGTYPHGEEHLEISPRAFYGNNGPFPEIEIKNVHTVLIQANAFYRKSLWNDFLLIVFI